MDRKTVIEGLTHCMNGFGCFGCPYSVANKSSPDCQLKNGRDALALLKEQQAEIERLREIATRDCDICANKMLKDERRWIPVSERLPEYTSQYLVWVGVNPIGMGMWMEQRTANFNTVTKQFSVDKSCKNEIIGSVEKWMELPQPPKEGEQDG